MMNLFHFIWTILVVNGRNNEESKYISNSCIGKLDGEYWIKFSDGSDNYIPVKLKCQNEYAILDINKDSNLKDYFSSFEMWHYGTGGPVLSDPVTWEEWFLSEDELKISQHDDTSYLISPDCNVCDQYYYKQWAHLKTVYYMSGNIAKLFWQHLSMAICDMDYDTYECYDCSACETTDKITGMTCHSPSIDWFRKTKDYDNVGMCTTTIQESTKYVKTTRSDSLEGATGNSYRPSIGTDGRFCVCYKPAVSHLKEFELTETEINVIQNYDNIDLNNEIHSKDDIYYLSQNDFLHGTLRIKNPGTYIITEDIEFDFNSDSEYPYWPTADQADEYPGAGGYRDQFFMGFFAGITIESDDVTIDLNGFELRQSLEFYYQQRWFAIIELSSAQFLPGQGPGFFSSDPVFINNFKVMNGVLGRTAHFGIHGNYPNGVIIEDVHIKNFVTHGIQLNGWENLVINNVEIGPSSTIEYLLGDYGHARLALPRLWDIQEQYPDIADTKTIQFSGRKEQTIYGIADELELQMEMALKYALNRAQNLYPENNYLSDDMIDTQIKRKRWVVAKKQFVNDNGLPSATSITGIFLNLHSVSVNQYTIYTDTPSKYGKVTNLVIHDLKHSFHEKIRLSSGDIKGIITPWNSLIDGQSIFENDDKMQEFYEIVNYNYENNLVEGDEGYNDGYKDFSYHGNILTDSYLAMDHFGNDDWNLLGMELLVSFTQWSTGKTDTYPWAFGCNNDIMTHSGKGLLGLRIDGAQNIELSNINIYNLEEETPLGMTVCGNYEKHDQFGTGGGGHIRQTTPMQTGFSGNNLQGISIISSKDVIIKDSIILDNFQNNHGDVYGMSLWPSNQIKFDSECDILISNMEAGKLIDDDMFRYNDLPNRAPEACGIRYETGNEFESDLFVTRVLFDDVNVVEDKTHIVDNLVTCNVKGVVSCFDDDEFKNKHTMIGQYYDSCDLIGDENNQIFSLSFINKINGKNNYLLIFASIFISVLILVCLYKCGLKYYFTKHVNDASNNEETPLISHGTAV